jgi:DDE superfamily endonuclease
MHLPACFAAVILTFAPVFVQQRTWRHAEVLLIGAILAPGKRTVTSLLRIAGLSRERRFTNYHRVLNRAAWDARVAARLLLGFLVAVFAPSGPVLLGIDDTIERRRGKRISAKGIYRDPVRSSKGHFVKASGLRWLSLMLLAPIPWAGRVWALPFLTALAPSKRYCRERGRRHKKLTDWARQMALQARRWLPGREVVLLGDSSFAALDLLAALARHGLVCVTRLRLDAALYQPVPPRQPGTVGRPRSKGARLPNLADLLATGDTCWVRVTVPGWYGAGERAVEVCSSTAVWRHAGRPVVPIRLRRLCRRSLRDRIDAAGIDGCCCAIRSNASRHRPCSAPIPLAIRCRSCAGSADAGRWKSPSGRCATISASRPNASGRTGRSRAPRRACSRCSRS